MLQIFLGYHVVSFIVYLRSLSMLKLVAVHRDPPGRAPLSMFLRAVILYRILAAAVF
jgi:hypothetical protein